MMYLKFMGMREAGPTQHRVIETGDYSVAVDDDGFRVYYEPGCYERVAPNCWLNCFVMSETGKTIDKIEAP